MTADPARFRRLISLVGEAMERDGSERDAWIEAHCADDPELLKEARSLLAQATTGAIDSLSGQVEAQIAAAAHAILPAATPERIGPYLVTGLLGEGGMGFVYAAHQEAPIARDVAIKVVRGGLSTPSIAARFDLERRTLATLQHPHIAQLFDAGATADGLPYFAMELVHGVPITDYCDQHRLDIDTRLDLFRKVLGAVHHAHQKAIVHRDLKPSNILVTEVDGVPTPKVIDFGIARVLSGESGITAVNTGQHVLGTREYMSPEQLSASPETVDIRSDIYSLAVLLYELLTGSLPFPSDQLRAASPLELERLLRDTDPPPPSRRVLASAEEGAARASARGTTPRHLARSLSGDLDTIVGTAMRKDPAHRYASAAQFADDIARYRAGLPITARPATLNYHAGRFIKRNRVGVAGTAVALLVLVATIGAFAWRLSEERDRARLEAAKAARVADFLEGLFSGSDPAVAVSPDVSARQLLDSGAVRISTQLEGQPALQASMLFVIGRTYRRLGLFSEAAERLEEALSLQETLYGDIHADVATTLEELGRVHLSLAGRLAEGEDEQRRALAIRTRLFGARDSASVATMQALATTLNQRGKRAEAESLLTAALAIQRTSPRTAPLDSAATLQELGTVLRNLSRLDEAERVLRSALAVRRQHLAATHPDVLMTMHSLAFALEQAAQYEEAEALFRERYELTARSVGLEHPTTVNALNSLAYMLWRTGSYARAEEHFREVVALGRRVYRTDHIVVGIGINNLAVALRRRGGVALAEAEQLQREAIEINRSAYGTDHPRTAADMDNLGRILLAQGRVAEAERTHRDALVLRTRLLDRNDLENAESLLGLGAARAAQGDLTGADSLMRTALAMRIERVGSRNARTANAHHDLGVLLHRQRRYDESEQHLREALAVRTAIGGPTHPDVALSMRELALVLRTIHRTSEADSLLRESRKILVERLGEDDPESRRATAYLRE